MADKKDEGLNSIFNSQYKESEVSSTNKTKKANSDSESDVSSKSNSHKDINKNAESKLKINPVWNVQLGIDQVAELNAIQSLKKLSSRTEALKVLLKFAKDNSFLKNKTEKSLFKSSVTLFLHRHKDKAIKQYRKYHEK